MNTDADAGQLDEHLHIRLRQLLSAESCRGLIERYERALAHGCDDRVSAEILEECAERIFPGPVGRLIRDHFRSDFTIGWSTYDVVDASPGYNTRWHLDSGIRGTLKLLLYLNPVADHGCNTPLIDAERTAKLRSAGALPLEHEARREDLGHDLRGLGLDTGVLTHDLEAGDGLLFNPLLLAHRCHPPHVGKQRHSICFTIFPG
ncbi:MAG: hypothetical protein ACPGUC_03165 [Gammaproteobacteria bacterium]